MTGVLERKGFVTAWLLGGKLVTVGFEVEEVLLVDGVEVEKVSETSGAEVETLEAVDKELAVAAVVGMADSALVSPTDLVFTSSFKCSEVSLLVASVLQSTDAVNTRQLHVNTNGEYSCLLG